MKQVRETTAGKSISAYVILNKKGEHVATVQSHYSNGGTCTVDVWSENGDPLQQGRAGGYGYDKFAAALAGLKIDGHTMADHCGDVPEQSAAKARLFSAYRKALGKPGFDQKAWNAKADKLGARFANYRSEDGGYSSLHFESGLDRLTMLGYRVISAI